MEKLKLARKKYLPSKPRIIFIAEAPPENIKRFFYYEKVKTGDALFINLMRVLYPELRKEHGGKVEDIRHNKAKILKRFQDDGYYLIDALPEPISLKLSSKDRVKLIEKRKEELADAISRLLGNEPAASPFPDKGVVLIKATVFDALEQYLLNDRQALVLNSHLKVPFPSHGHTTAFAEALHKILSHSDRRYRYATRLVWYSGDIVIQKKKDTK